MRQAPVIAATAALALTGCGGLFDGTPDRPLFGVFGGIDEVQAAAPIADAAAGKARASRIQTIEFGRTPTGFAIAVTGLAPSAGYSAPELRPTTGGQPKADGYLEFELVAVPPVSDPQKPLSTAEPARRIRADLLLNRDEIGLGRGVRVVALEGGAQRAF